MTSQVNQFRWSLPCYKLSKDSVLFRSKQLMQLTHNSMFLDLQSILLPNTACKNHQFTIGYWQSIKTLYLYSYNNYSNTHLHLQDSKVVPNPLSSSSTLPCYVAVGHGVSTSAWHILWHDPHGKPLSGAASAPQRSDGPAALPHHSPARAPYVNAHVKIKKGVFTIYIYKSIVCK